MFKIDSKYFRLRVGDYRVILDMIDNELIIHVVEIGHRKKRYKSLRQSFDFTSKFSNCCVIPLL
ncbi:hypothetical protein IPdc08_00735 [archaeon]|nr:hypothetical protein IPdc08_00735 [archaeon]